MKGTIMSEIKLNYHKTHFLTSAQIFVPSQKILELKLLLQDAQMQENQPHLMR